MQEPLVSVVFSSYNHQNYVRQMIESVLNQTYTNIEVLGIDDCSTDSTYNILSEYKEDSRFNLIRNKLNLGVVNNVNKLIQEANGEYIAFIGSDDIWEPNKTYEQLKYFESHPETGCLFTFVDCIDRDGNIYAKEDARDISSLFNIENLNMSLICNRFITNGNFLCHPSCLIKKRTIEKAGLFNPLYFQLHDFDYWTRVALFSDIAIIEKPLTKYRWVPYGSSNISAATKDNDIRVKHESVIIIKKFIQNIPDKLFRDAFKHTFNDEYSDYAHINAKKFLIFKKWVCGIDPISSLEFLDSLQDVNMVLDVLAKDYNYNLLDLRNDTGLPLGIYPIDVYDEYRAVIKSRDELRVEVVNLQNELEEFSKRKDYLQIISNERLAIINDMQNSTSWKLTKPIRALGRMLNQ